MKRLVQGTTILEMLVAFTLIVVATGMMVALFVPSMSLFRRQSGKSDSYRGCVMLLEKFRIGLLNSQLETVTVAPSGHAVSWQNIDEDTPFSATTGDPIMATDFGVLYYAPSEQKVYYKEITKGLGGAPTFLSLAELDSAISSQSAQTRVVARNITDFKVADKDGDVLLLEPPLSLNMTCEIATKGTQTNDVEQFTLETSVTPRSMRW